MKPDEIRKLLGGYATGTLTEEERNLLYSAALEDQELFDALADEEVLRAFLAEPAMRESLMEELQRQPAVDPRFADDRRVPANFAAYPAPGPVPITRAERPNVARPFWLRLWDDLTPRRLAVAGGLAMILLIAGGVQYVRSHGEGTATVAMVHPATNAALERTPTPVGEPAAAQVSARDQEQAAKQATTARTESVERDRATSPNDERRVAVAAGGARDTAGPEQKAEKGTVANGLAREELNQAVREEVAQARSKENGSVESSAAQVAPPAPSRSSGNLPVRPSSPSTPSQIVVGGLTSAAAPPPPGRKATGLVEKADSRQTEAKVTDVNGTIVSINVGANQGFHAGDVVEIVRDNRVIATSKLSQVGSTFAVGPLQLAAGTNDSPRTGDMVRRAAASQPQR